jgi:hypothetical protein
MFYAIIFNISITGKTKEKGRAEFSQGALQGRSV